MNQKIYYMQNKLQTVYLPTSDNTVLMVGTIDKYDYYKSFQKERNVEETDRIIFTLEEFETFKREFGKELLISSANEGEFRKSIRQLGDLIIDELPKKVIEVVLDEYLLNNKI